MIALAMPTIVIHISCIHAPIAIKMFSIPSRNPIFILRLLLYLLFDLWFCDRCLCRQLLFFRLVVQVSNLVSLLLLSVFVLFLGKF